MFESKICLEHFLAKAIALRKDYDLQKLSFYRTKIDVLNQIIKQTINFNDIPDDFWIKCTFPSILDVILEPLNELYNTFNIKIACVAFKYYKNNGIKCTCFNFIVSK